VIACNQMEKEEERVQHAHAVKRCVTCSSVTPLHLASPTPAISTQSTFIQACIVFFSFFRRLRDACACAPHVRPTSSSLLSPLPSHAASSAVPPFSVAADAGVWCRYGAIRWWRRAAFCTSSLRRCFRRSRPRTGTPSRLQIH
jgi:hypothetical protein